MAGNNQSQGKLNYTLKYITIFLIQHKITNWFIGYGTLLGIVRNNTCIDGDDDIDLVCDRNDFERIHKLLKENNIQVTFEYGIQNTRSIIKTVETDTLASIDFYCTEVNKVGHFNDEWENVIWTYCYIPNTQILPYITWNNIFLPIPYNCINKLCNRYGKQWYIPEDTKGPMPRLRYL